jgi:hypothetical protein
VNAADDFYVVLGRHFGCCERSVRRSCQLRARVASSEMDHPLLWFTMCIACRIECLSLRVEGYDGVCQVVADENVGEVVGCC